MQLLKGKLWVALLGLPGIINRKRTRMIAQHLKLKKPCGNCPFLKEGAIGLEYGRLQGIIDNLMTDDMSTFRCHKTVHNSRTGGEFLEDGAYIPSGKESMCAGAMVYLEKAGRSTVAMRIGRAMRVYHPDNLASHFDAVIDC